MMASPYVPSNRATPPAESLSGGSIPLSPGALLSSASSPAAATAIPRSTAPLAPSTAPLPPLSVVRSTATAALSDVSSAVPLAAADAGRAAASAAPAGSAHSVPSAFPSTKHDCYCSLLDFLLLVGQLKKLKRTGWLRNGIQPHKAETVAEHSFRAAVCALLIGSDSQSAELIAQGKLDKNKCVKMALVHDLAEALVGDITPFCPVSPDEKRRREKEAMKQICALLPAAPPVSSAALRGCPACTACWNSSMKGDSRGVPGCNETITSSSIGSSGRSSPTDVSGAAAEVLSLFEEYEAGETAEAKFVLDIDKFEMVLQAFEYEAEAYSNSTPLENNKRLRAHEPELPHSAETRAAQRVEGLPALNVSEPHQQDLEEEADIHRQQKNTIFPQQPHESQQQDWQQQQQAQQGGQSDGQSTTLVLQRQQQGLTAYPLTSIRQSPQVESHEFTDNQQQQQQQDQHQHARHRPHETQLPSTRRRKTEGKETAQHGLRLSSFFQTTRGVFKSCLFQMLDTLLRERRKELHDTEEP